MFQHESAGELFVLAVALLFTLLKVAVPMALVGWWFMRRGRRNVGDVLTDPQASTPAITEQLRVVQDQLEDVYARLDFAEWVMTEQRDQLRVLGGTDGHPMLSEPTPI